MTEDLVLINGKIITMNPSQPSAEAVAIKDAKIIQVGDNIDVKQFIGPKTRILDLKGKTVVPGFIDSHIHVCDLARVLSWIDLSNVKSITEMQTLIKAHVEKAPKGKWLVGKGWDQNSFAEKRIPTRYDLDIVSSDNPLILYQKFGQMCVANTKALQIAGLIEQPLDSASPDADATIETEEHRGILRGDATSAVWKFVPTMTEEELLEATALACERIVQAGITSIGWIVFSATELSIAEKLNAQHRLPLNVYIILPESLIDNALSSPLYNAPANSAARISGVMLFADGYLASHIASIHQPYTDPPNTVLNLLYTQKDLHAIANKVQKVNLQLIIHAAGDKAIDLALTVMEQNSREAAERKPRHRLEQGAVLNQTLIQRMKTDDVIASVQPCVIASEFSVYSAAAHLGPERLRWLYPLKTLARLGIKVVGGSDCPMEPLNPLLGIQALVAREFMSQERVTLQEAIRFYTIDAAYAFSVEETKGSIEQNKYADLTVLSDDLMTAEPSKTSAIKVEMTFVNGDMIYSKQ